MSSKSKGKEKEEKDSSKKIVKKENHFATKGDSKSALLLKQSFYLLLSRETSLCTAVATYPSAGGRRMTRGCVFQERNKRGVATNVYLRKTSEKPEKTWSTNFKWKGSGVVFMHGERISTPRVCHKGRQPSIKWQYHVFNLFYFPILYFYVFLCLFIFFIFLWSTRVFPSLLHILNCDKEIRPT